MTLETYANNFITTLAGNGGSISSGATTINLASGTGAPSGQSRFVIGTEIIIGSISGTVLTATTRGAESTTAQSHADGSQVSCVLTVASLAANPGVMTTAGDIEYMTSGGPARLGVGSTGNILTVAAGAPSWAPPATTASPRILYYDDCSSSSIPSGPTVTGFTYDSTRLCRIASSSATYQSANFPLNGPISAQVIHENTDPIANGSFTVELWDGTINHQMVRVAYQSDGNVIVYDENGNPHGNTGAGYDQVGLAWRAGVIVTEGGRFRGAAGAAFSSHGGGGDGTSGQFVCANAPSSGDNFYLKLTFSRGVRIYGVKIMRAAILGSGV